MEDKTHSRNANEQAISQISKITLPRINNCLNKKKKLIIPKFKIKNRLVGKFIYPIEQLVNNNIPLPQTHTQKHSKTPKLTNQYTQKLSVLLNSNDKEYLAKRKRIDQLIISYCDNTIKLTDPNKEPDKKVRSISFTSRNNNNNKAKNGLPWNISNNNKPNSQSFKCEITKFPLDIPEFNDKEIDFKALTKEVKKGLEDYYQLNSIENENELGDTNNQNCNCDSDNMVVLYNKAKQQHNVANRINSLLANNTHTKVPNLSEIFKVLNHNQSSSDLNSPSVRPKHYKESFDYSRYKIQKNMKRNKSQIRLNDIKTLTFKNFKDQKEVNNIMSLNKKIPALLPQQEVLFFMNEQNSDLSLLVDQCKNITNEKNRVNIRSTYKHLSHNIKIARSPKVNLSLKNIKLASVSIN